MVLTITSCAAHLTISDGGVAFDEQTYSAEHRLIHIIRIHGFRLAMERVSKRWTEGRRLSYENAYV